MEETNAPMMDAMKSVDNESLWSVPCKNETQSMMRQMLGEAASGEEKQALTVTPLSTLKPDLYRSTSPPLIANLEAGCNRLSSQTIRR
jgi:hypothetical protein